AVAYRWKTQFNENAKMHAFAHAFPELSHNEIVGWEGARDGRFAAVVLRDPSDDPGALRRLDVAVDLIEDDADLVERVVALVGARLALREQIDGDDGCALAASLGGGLVAGALHRHLASGRLTASARAASLTCAGAALAAVVGVDAGWTGRLLVAEAAVAG